MKKILVLISLILLFTSIIGCSQIVDKEHFVGREKFYPIADNFNSLIGETDVIVKGSFYAFDSKWNMARNPENIQEEDPNLLVEGLLYKFEVNEFIAGEGNNDILVNLEYSFADKLSEYFMEPDFGKEVILFLKFNKDFDHYYGVMEPFRFEVDGENIKVKTNIKKIENNFKDKATKESLKDKVKKISFK